LAAGAFSIVPRHVLGAGATPPSEQLTKGVIGVGGMGRGHIKGSINPESRLVAIADVEDNHIAEARKMVGNEPKAYKDWRELIDRKDVDIVHIATPPHWHALMSVAAANAGKDIWCEKPLSRTIGEGQKVVEAVQRNGRIFRLNTWFRFEGGYYGFGTSVKPIKQIVNAGLLGWPLKATVNGFTGFGWKLDTWKGRFNLTPQPVPKTLDYDMWLGPAPWKPYHPHRVHGSFRGYWDYDGGGLGDMGQHYLDPVQYLLEKDETSPVEIIPEGPSQHHDAVVPWTRVTLKYADGCEIILDGVDRDKDAPFLEGPKGKLWPEMRSSIPNLKEILAGLPEPEPQNVNFTDCVKRRKKFALNEANGHRSCTLMNISTTALRVGRALKFDPVAQLFVNDDEANRFVHQPMRAPWRL
jgi:myo-inositol 2-dehydrogenase / D-chiro-inositol 1-dehydrogenase